MKKNLCSAKGKQLFKTCVQQRALSDHGRGVTTCQDPVAHFINIHKKLNVQIN